jgi:lysophospholipase L1-like esterase
MSKQTRQNIIIALITIILSVSGLELFVRLADPLGIIQYQDDLRFIYSAAKEHEARGVALVPGQYKSDRWSFSIGYDGYRVTPSRNYNAECTIAMIGDSVTFGFGVNDGETFTELLQKKFGGFQFINSGVSGYNSGNFEPTASEIGADGYIYTQIINDYAPALRMPTTKDRHNIFAGLEKYAWVIWSDGRRQHLNNNAIWSQYGARYDGFLERDNLLIFTPHHNAWLIDQYGATSIGIWDSVISPRDGHPTPEGHRQLANEMAEYVETFLTETCSSVVANK